MLTFLVNLFVTLVSSLASGLYRHVRTFYMTLDPIQEVPSAKDVPPEVLDSRKEVYKPPFRERVQQNLHFLFPFVMMTVINSDSFLMLARAGFNYRVNGFPYLITHRIYPPELYLEGDTVCNLGIFLENFTYAFLLFLPHLDPRYAMYCYFDRRQRCWVIVSNGRTWSRDSTEKILQYRKKARRVFSCIMLSVLVQLYTYWTGSLAVKPTKNLKDYAIFAGLPFFALYSSFGKS